VPSEIEATTSVCTNLGRSVIVRKRHAGPDSAVSIEHTINQPNVREAVRAHYTGWYTDLVTDLPIIENGFASLPAKPGLGTDLLPGLDQRPDAHVRVTTAADLP
jgi:hypothetical protein